MYHLKRKLFFWGLILLLSSIACSTLLPNNSQDQNPNAVQEDIQVTQEDPVDQQPQPTNTVVSQVEDTSPTLDPLLGEMEFFQLLDSGGLNLEGIQANSDEADTYGPILTLQLTNPGTEEVVISIPCGLVFVPGDDQYQRLMMVQPLEVELAPGETQSSTPYVVCIDVSASAPEYNETYSIGTLADNPDLLKFAECICNQELGDDLASMDGLGVQMAAWSISTGGDFANLSDEEGAMADLFEEEFGEDIDEMLSQFTEMFASFGGEWLERCEIELEN